MRCDLTKCLRRLKPGRSSRRWLFADDVDYGESIELRAEILCKVAVGADRLNL